MRLNELILILQKLQYSHGNVLCTTNGEHGVNTPEIIEGAMIEYGIARNIHSTDVFPYIKVEPSDTIVHIGGY